MKVSATYLLQEGGYATTVPFVRKIGKDLQGHLRLKPVFRYNYPSNRYYHRFRNNVMFLNEYDFPRDDHQWLHFMKRLVHDCVLEKHRIANIKAACSGIVAGKRYLQVKGKMR